MKQAPGPFPWRPLLWVPALYFSMGLPNNAIVGGLASRMYKSLGHSDAEITVALGSLSLAWSLKPLWASVLDGYKSKRFFVLTMEALLAAIFACLALAVPGPDFFRIGIALLWVGAFASSTQDICADGLYLVALDRRTQALLAGLQGAFWVLGRVCATGLLIWAAEKSAQTWGWTTTQLWQVVLASCAGLLSLLVVYNRFVLPEGPNPRRAGGLAGLRRDFVRTAQSFFEKKAFWGMIGFVFLYRLGEGLLLLEGPLFLQSAREQGGCGLSPGQVSAVEAVWGTLAGLLGGLIGGWLVGRRGLGRSLWLLGLFLNVPHLTYVVLAYGAATPEGLSLGFIAALVCLEKFGYGLGFVGNMIYMMQQLAPGPSAMTHYAYATALMSLMMVPTNMISGPLAEALGFKGYFLLVMLASLPSVWVAFRAPFPRGTEEGLEAVEAQTSTRTEEGGVSRCSPSGAASMTAMAHLLLLLIVDTSLLGWLQGAGRQAALVLVVLLFLNGVCKFLLIARAYRLVRAVLALPSLSLDEAANARGARLASHLGLVLALPVLALALLRVF